jgi:hypothetical protein
MDKEYCGLRTSVVKASSRAGRSRKGTSQKPKKAHSRRSCYGTGDASLSNTANCRHSSDTNRCVVRGKTADDDLKADARRAKSRSKNATRRSKRASEYELLPNPGLEGGRPKDERGVKIPSMEYCKVKEGQNKCVMTDKPEEQSPNCLHNLTTRRCIYYDPDLGDDVFEAQQKARECLRNQAKATRAAERD